MLVHEILKQLRIVGGKLDKESILHENKDNEILKRVFELAYSPTINFNIKKIPNYVTEPQEGYGLDDALYDLHLTLVVEGSRGHEARDYLGAVLSSLEPQEAAVVRCVISGDMRCGCGANTINKVWKGLIVKPPRQGASSMNEKTLAKMEKCDNLAIELKSDGSYAASVCGDNPSMMSRNGNPLEGLDSILEELAHPAYAGMALEGELVYDLTKATREVGNGVIGKVVKGTASEEERNNVYYQVWDCIDLKHYESKGKYPLPNSQRRGLLELMVEESGSKFITIIPRTENVSMEEAHSVFEQYVRDGYEGAILKDMNAGWSDIGKPSCCVKLKRKEPADLLVVGMEEGKGKASGMMGKVLLESSCGRIKVKCGSGFSDEQRIHYWENNPTGSVFETEYDSITKDKKTGQESLFLPIFKQERFDKDESDSYTDILNKQRI